MIAAECNPMLSRAASVTVQTALVPCVLLWPVRREFSFRHQGPRFAASAELLGVASVEVPSEGFRPAVESSTAQQSRMASDTLDHDCAQSMGIHDVAAKQPRFTGVLDWLEGGWRLVSGGLFGQDVIHFCDAETTGIRVRHERRQ